jgi:hypothetical protein
MTRKTVHNTGLAKVAVQCSASTFVVNQSLVLRVNICGENRHLRQARKRCMKPLTKIAVRNDVLIMKLLKKMLLHDNSPPKKMKLNQIFKQLNQILQ